jgi:hypothetical protein
MAAAAPTGSSMVPLFIGLNASPLSSAVDAVLDPGRHVASGGDDTAAGPSSGDTD